MKDIAFFCTRTLNRSLRHQFRKFIRRPWLDSLADLYIMIHGDKSHNYDADIDLAINEQLASPHKLPFFKVLDYRGITELPDLPGFYSSPITKYLAYDLAKRFGYQRIAFVDDDLDFGGKNSFFNSIEFMNDRLKNDPSLGMIGPVYGQTLFFNIKYGPAIKDPYGVASIERRPWTTFGVQCYNMKALEESVNFEVLKLIHRHSDVFLNTALHSHGFRLEHANIPFNHKCNRGMCSSTPPTEAVLRRYDYDWNLIISHLPEFGRSLDGNGRIPYHKHLRAYRKSDEKWFRSNNDNHSDTNTLAPIKVS